MDVSQRIEIEAIKLCIRLFGMVEVTQQVPARATNDLAIFLVDPQYIHAITFRPRALVGSNVDILFQFNLGEQAGSVDV